MGAILLPIIAGAANLLRVPAMAAFFAALFGEFVAWFARWFTAKTAMQLGIVAAVVSLTTVIFATIKLTIAGIALVFPGVWMQAVGMVVPDNLSICVSSLIAARIVRWVWIWQVHFIELYAVSR